MPKRTFLPMLLAVLPALTAFAAPADDAYQDAKGAYAKLKADEAKRKFRHHWLNVAHKFDKVAGRWPKSDRAPEALFNAAELYSELSRFSQNADDLAASEAAYRQLTSGYPKHKLSDDAAFGLARLLADRRNAPAQARAVLEAALEKGGGDKKGELSKLLGSLPKPAAPPPAATGSSVSDAIRKIARKDPPPPEAAKKEKEEAPVAVRLVPKRVPIVAPEEEEDEAAPVDNDAVVEGLKLPTLTNLQERLRDVRVGEKPLPEADPVVTKRLKQAAKDGRHAEFTLAEQLGLKMRRVVIDAGHGGHDTGAIGPSGVQEKDVALAIALQVAKQLTAAGLEVLLTRDDDTFVRLEDRAKFANAHKGDLFLSIHCNAGPSKKMRGIETYTLNTSADRYSIRLAARENATSERGVSDLQFILADLATKANTEESSRLAQRVQRSLVRDLSQEHKGVRDLGTKEALFYVLLGAKMPAILVETSFLSHPEEEKLLGDVKYQSQVATAISDAVSGFLEEREAKLARID